MTWISKLKHAMARQVGLRTAQAGRPVDVAALKVLDRSRTLALAPPGLCSPNGACRLVRAADGWMAVNLAREDDRDLIPAWLSCNITTVSWAAISAYAINQSCGALVERASLLGLPAAAVGEVTRDTLVAPRIRFGRGAAAPSALKVVDIAALWAGPMCGGILAAMGASVTRFESPSRRDPTRVSMPDFFRRRNGAKRSLDLDLTQAHGRLRLSEAVNEANILITSARPRALSALGLEPVEIFATNPGLVWVAVTGYGWTGPAAARVAFGDDAAAAGGLVGWTSGGEPRFLGDALADPSRALSRPWERCRRSRRGAGCWSTRRWRVLRPARRR